MPIETWTEPSGLFGMGAGPVSPITNVTTQGAGGLVNINPLAAGFGLAYNLYRGLSAKQKAESQKRDNLFLLTLDEMRKAGEDPYEKYPEELFDVSQYPEFAGLPAIGTPEEMQNATIAQAVSDWRARNNDVVQKAYDDFLKSGKDYDEYSQEQYGVSGTGGDSGVPAGADIFTSTIDDSTIEPESIEEDTEPTLAEIIGGWLERQEGPVTQEKILDVLGRYGRTPEDFNEAVADVEGIPSFEDFVSETDLQGEGDTPTTDEEVEEPIDDSTTQQPSVGYRPPPVFQPDEPTPPESPLEKPDEPPTFIMPTLPEEEVVDEEFNGLLAISAPNRTTTEVLAPDLFKLDNNIPLVGKLTQYTPMTAPQYLLSGISQRYRV